MKIKALVTALVLGSSSVALADHTVAQAPQPMVRDHRAPIAQPLKPAPVQQSYGFGWQRWARPQLLVDNAHLAGRTLVSMPASYRSFTKLELRSNNGRTSIDRVVITFGNGQRQVIALNATVTGKNSVKIDLPGGSRNIKSVVLLGNSHRRATIDVLGV
jgi:hypothetical protein